MMEAINYKLLSINYALRHSVTTLTFLLLGESYWKGSDTWVWKGSQHLRAGLHTAQSAVLGCTSSFLETSPPLPWEACGRGVDWRAALGGGCGREQPSCEGEQRWLQPSPTSAPWTGWRAAVQRGPLQRGPCHPPGGSRRKVNLPGTASQGSQSPNGSL